MEPSHLSNDELQYELNIRGVFDITDKRVATKTLRIDLNNELKNLRPSHIGKLSPLRGRQLIESLDQTVSGLLGEFSGAKVRKDQHAQAVLVSKLIHYKGKVERLQGSDAEEVGKIEKLQDEIKMALEGTRTGNAPQSLGAIPKQVAVLERPEVGVEGASSMERVANNDEQADQSISGKTVNALITGPPVNENPFSNRSPLFDRNVQADNIRNVAVGVPDFDEILNRAGNERQNENENANREQNRRTSNTILPAYDSNRSYELPRLNPPIAPRQSVPENISAPRSSGNFSQNYSGNATAFNNNSHTNERRQDREVYIENQGNQRRSPIEHDRQQNRDNYYENRGGSRRPQNGYNRTEPLPRRRNPIAEWNLTFSGDSKDTSLNDFLSQVMLLARAERVSDEDLLMSAVYLFKGSAYTWYRAFHPYYETWGQLVAGLKSQFLPVDYDFWLLKELEQRRQGESENFGIFFAAMEMLFRNLSYRLSEPQKLAIVMRNMHPLYVDRLSLENIYTLPQLAERCKRIEQARYRVSRQGHHKFRDAICLNPHSRIKGRM